MNYYFLSILIPFQLSHLLQSLFLDFVLNIKTGLSMEKKNVVVILFAIKPGL